MLSLFVEIFAVVECLLFVLVGVFSLAGPLPGIPDGAGLPLILLACAAGALPGALVMSALIAWIKHIAG